MFPLFHVTARSAVVTATMWAGGRVHLADGFSATRFWDEVKQANATWFGYMGIVIHLLHAQPRRPDDSDNNVRIAFGAAAPPGDHDAVRGALRHAAGRGLRLDRARPRERARVPHPRKPGTMGLPCRHLLVEVHDEDDNPLPPERARRDRRPPRRAVRDRPGLLEQARARRSTPSATCGSTPATAALDDEGYLVFTDRLKDPQPARREHLHLRGRARRPAPPRRARCAAYAVPVRADRGRGDDRAGRHARATRSTRRTCSPSASRTCRASWFPATADRGRAAQDAVQRIEKYRLGEQGVTPDTFDREAAGLAVPRS